MDPILGLSILIRLIGFAWSIVLWYRLRDWRISFLAVLLMLMVSRQSMTLLRHAEQAGAVTFPGDLTELPGLVVSVMAFLVVVLVGDLIVRRGTPVREIGKGPAKETWKASTIALTVGGETIGLGFVAGYMAYQTSRREIHRTVARQNLSMARSLINGVKDRLSRQRQDAPALRVDVLRELRTAWDRFDAPYKGSYLCVIEKPGVLALHTKVPKMVGRDVGEVVVDPEAPAPRKLKDLLATKEDWYGRNVNFRGMHQLVGYGYMESLDALVVVHVPAQRIEQDIRAAVLPWGVSLALVCGILLPFCLGLMQFSYSRSQRLLRQTLSALSESEVRVRAQYAELELIYRTAPVGLCLMDTDLRFLRINEYLAVINGPSVGDHIGKTLREVLLSLADTLEPIYRHVLDTGESVIDREVHGVTAAEPGVERDWIISYHSLQDPQGKVIGVNSVVLEVTERIRMENALREREAHLRAIFEAEPECVKLLAEDGSLIEMNPAGLRMIEADSFQQVAHECMYPLVIEKHREAFRALTERVFQGASGILEFQITGLKGGRRWLETHAGPLRDTNGAVIALLGVTRDVTALEQAKDRQQRLLAILDATPDFVGMLDKEGRTVYVNRAGRALMGFGEDEDLSGLRLRDSVSLETGEHIESVGIPTAIREGHWYNETTFLTRDGRAVLTSQVVLAHKSADGTVENIATIARDITGTKQAQVNVAALHERNKALVSALAEIVYDWRPPREEVSWEGDYTRVLGYSPEEMGTHTEHWTSRVHPEDLERVLAEVDDATRERRCYDLEYRFRAKDGRYQWMHDRGVTFVNEQGVLERIIGVFIDVSERKRAEEALQTSRARLALLSRQLITAQETERRHLARELHDEIGQVLTAVHISLQQARGVCPPAAWPRLDEASRIVDRAIQEVRTMSLDLRPAMLDDFGLVAALRWFVERQQRSDCKTELEIESCGMPLPPELSNTCYRIIQEALTNVRRHARAKQVRVEVLHTPDEVRLLVRDDGVGFDPVGVRERAARGRSFGILGMQERVELLGGQFHLESAAGQGTTVRVEMPLPAEEDAERTGSEDEEAVEVEPS